MNHYLCAVSLVALAAYSTRASAETAPRTTAGGVIAIVDFGAKCDGVTDDAPAFAAARAAAGVRPISLPAGTCVSSKQTITQDTTYVGQGRFTTSIKLAAGTNDHLLYVRGDHKLVLRDLGLDGNAAANMNVSLHGQVGVLVPVGSLDMSGCYVHAFKGHAVSIGNVDYDFDVTRYAHDVYVVGNLFDQTTPEQPGGPSPSCPYASATAHWSASNASCLGDQMRIYRTRNGVVAGNFGKGGLSGFRANYYNDHLVFQGNTVTGTYGDTGITYALSTDGVVSGNVVTDHGGNGIEVDACWRCTIANNVACHNGLYGLLMGEYGPPVSWPQYAGTMMDDGSPILISHKAPFNSRNNSVAYTSKNVTVSGNTLCQNMRQGAVFVGQGGPLLFAGNLIADNDREGSAGGNTGGVYVDGGLSNRDGVTITGNTFHNVNRQLGSVQQSNVQFTTVVGGNTHLGGQYHFTSATRGTRQLNPDPNLVGSTSGSVTSGHLVADATSPTGYARQIEDRDAHANCALETRIAVPGAGKKMVFLRFRTPDTLSKVEVVVDLLVGTASKHTAYDSTRIGVGASWTELAIPVPDATRYPYDGIRVQFVTGGADPVAVGTLNVQEVSVFTTGE
jgi:parallel beta-helix repeat protein